MNFERVEISTVKGKGSNFGLILVLFILLVIVTSLFRSPINGDSGVNLEDDNSTILATKGFNVYNKSALQPFLLRAASFNGNYASPPDPLHIIRPGESYHFEVDRYYFYVSEAYVTYDLLDMNGTRFGDARLRMRVDTHVASTTVLSLNTTIYFPVGIENGGTYFNFVNR
ncbi:sporulation protein YjcZ [Paenibacillus herberti]|uniref:Uncharacterized protein n=1 Tax=Paenibacillus herberti TaxID=1619309 RepID=A0A229P3G5_9BACL|nr:sporulation protein YjcZ [Paenibacillus herberti]OXM16484.1 hypothetical protein CGZ75_07370 [Paenibacillus herberti]